MIQGENETSSHATVPPPRASGAGYFGDFVDLLSPSAVDSLAVRKIAEIEARDTETAAFWIEVTEHMKTAEVQPRRK